MPSNIIRDFEMVKAKAELKSEIKDEAKEIHPLPDVKKIILRIFMWLIFLLILLGLWLNPEVIYNSVDYVKNMRPTENKVLEQPSINEVQKQIFDLQNRIYNIGAEQAKNASGMSAEEINLLNQRFDNIEKQNISIIDSKADIASVMGIVNRLDKIEQRLDAMAKVSDQGALILTAAMMIKDSAERGNNFEYEAEILSQLADKESALKEPAAEILKFSNQAIPSSKMLVEEFDELYQEVMKAEKDKMVEGKTWKERLNIKLKEYVKVKNTKKDAKIAADEKVQDNLEMAYLAVNSDQFAKAIEILENPENQAKLKEYNGLQEWVDDAKIRVDFYNAISKISTYSLALMKLNYIKKDVANQN